MKPAILIFGCYWGFVVSLQFILLQAHDAEPNVIWVGLVAGFLSAALCLGFFWNRFLPTERIEKA